MSYRESDRRRWQRERFSRRERRHARIKDGRSTAAMVRRARGDVIWEDLGDDHEINLAGRGRLSRSRSRPVRRCLHGACAVLPNATVEVRAIALVALFIIPTVMVLLMCWR